MSDSLVELNADELLHMADTGFRHELVKGRIRTMPLRGFENGLVVSAIGVQLGHYVVTQDLGRVFAAGTGFLLECDPDTVFAPAVAFVHRARFEVIGLSQAFFPEAPALVVEVASPNDTIEEVDSKIRRWLAAGVELAWVVNPSGRTVTVYRALDEIQVFTENDTLSGESVVPGFECNIADIFAGLQ